MTVPLFPCLWFDGKAADAAALYTKAFPDASLVSDNGLTVLWHIGGQQFMGLNGGPQFKPNPSVSFFWHGDTEDELRQVYHVLVEGGSVLMELGAYDFAPLYSWVQDRFGVSWQLMLSPGRVGPRVVPSFLFTGAYCGRAREALGLWESIFSGTWTPGSAVPGSKSAELLPYGEANLDGRSVVAMDSDFDHAFVFTEGVSMVVTAKDQAEIDYYWAALSEGGEESMCGWLKDRFGISWQVVPAVLGELMGNPQTSERVMKNFLTMKKFEISRLLD